MLGLSDFVGVGCRVFIVARILGYAVEVGCRTQGLESGV